ncbi:MAG: 5,5-dehydrodivanillate O-demethylase oxygenase subunit, partial [Solirubrobacteraceae bacterium]|nr:5,5-dehydrodivanillate O-demethylase oxygenase subunit [Solirubrobacteraceae bacterium]
MLTAEQNDELTQVEAGTPMGEVLRRYWYPVAFTRELEEFPVKRVELLGEFFALWKSPSGRMGIVPEACPHRKASLAYGVVEADGIRCPYHGWVFDVDGACTEQPAERDNTQFQDRVRAQAGTVEEMGGLIWAYVGPSPAPELPRFDTYVMDGYRDIGWADLPCNYVQIMENAVDPHHVEFLHGRYFEFVGRHEGFTAPASFGKEHVKIGFTAFEWGIIKRRVLKGASEENDDWKVGHPLVFPYNMRVGGGGIHQMQIRVPVNRTTTRFYLYTVHGPDGYEHVEQPQIPDYELP